MISGKYVENHAIWGGEFDPKKSAAKTFKLFACLFENVWFSAGTMPDHFCYFKDLINSRMVLIEFEQCANAQFLTISLHYLKKNWQGREKAN